MKRLADAHWHAPRKWNADARRGARRHVVRVVGDVFEDRRDLDPSRINLWWLIRDTPHLDWQLVTTRPEKIARLLPEEWRTELPANVRIEVAA